MENTLPDLLEDHFQAKTKLKYLQERKELAEKEVKHFERKIESIEAHIADISSQIESLHEKSPV